MQPKISDRVVFEADGAVLVLKKDGETAYSVDLILPALAREAAAEFGRKIVEKQDSYRGSVEDVVEEAKHVMDITQFSFGINIAIARAAECNETLSRSMP